MVPCYNIDLKARSIAPQLNAFDIVCLQECYVGDNTLANNTNFKYIINPEQKRHFYTLDSGLLVLSNMNLYNTYFELYYDYDGFYDSIVSKGFLMTRWKINGKFLDVYNISLQQGGRQSGFDAAQGQVDQLVRGINKLTPKEHGLLVVGIFNVGPLRNKTYTELSSLYEDEITMMNCMNIFNSLVIRLHLLDVWDMLHPNPTYDGFERCLFRNGTNISIQPNTIQWGNSFYDSRPIIVNLTIS
jgi:hypothetical protein